MTLEHSRIARPIAPGGRSLGWWGAVLGLATLAHFVGGLHVATVYLRAFTSVWPPTPGPTPTPAWPAAAAGLAVAGAVLVTVGDRRVRAGRPAAGPLLAVAGVLAAAGAVVRAWDSLFGGWPMTEHAFWSIHWTIGAMDTALLATLAVIALVSALHVRRGVVLTGRHAELAVVTLWAWVTAAFVVVSVVVFASVTTWGAGT